MESRIIGHSMLAVAVAVFAAACDKSSPTSPSQGSGGGGTTVSSIAITGDLTLSEGQTSQLTATATMTNGTTQIITAQATWSSANQAVATVSSGGLVTARRSGTVQVTATFGNRAGSGNVQVSAATYRFTVRADTISAWGTCDGLTQGSSKGEFAYQVAALRNGTNPTIVSETRSYPGNSSNPFVLELAELSPVTLSDSAQTTAAGQEGQSIDVVFRATEWDTKVTIIPPSISYVRDVDMDDLSRTRNHIYQNGSWSDMGSKMLTIGNSTCGIILNYFISAVRE